MPAKLPTEGRPKRYRPIEADLKRIHHHGQRRFAHHPKYGWMAYLQSDLGAACSGWLPCSTPAHIQAR